MPIVCLKSNIRFEIIIIIFAEFRECFYLFARSGQIRTLDELTIIMRSLGLSPTIAELNKYMKDKGKKYSNIQFSPEELFRKERKRLSCRF